MIVILFVLFMAGLALAILGGTQIGRNLWKEIKSMNFIKDSFKLK